MAEVLFSFRKLKVYQEAKSYTLASYALIKNFPPDERFAMTQQIRRAASSIPFNIAEGSGRYSTKEQLHFVGIAFGSLNETLSQFDLAHDLCYITDEEWEEIGLRYKRVAYMLSCMRRSLLARENATQPS
ncbi:MAG: four helix bundle protein [Bacteroidaceae bacterium]|nr:four helix bundle protein [Bacteroidaceae bacterium]